MALDQHPEELIPTRWSLVARLKDLDDQQSWREFYEIYWRLIHSVAVKAGLSNAEAHDAVQETIISVAKTMPEFKADPAAGSFKNWLLVITRRRIVDRRGPAACRRSPWSGTSPSPAIRETRS